MHEGITADRGAPLRTDAIKDVEALRVMEEKAAQRIVQRNDDAAESKAHNGDLSAETRGGR